MGAEYFTTSALGASPEDAFRDAVREALHECGHGGYTGTIAEKGSFTIIDRTLRSLSDAFAYAETLSSDPRVDDKWGDAGAIPYIKDQAPAKTRTARVTVTVPGPEVTHQSITEAITAKAPGRAGEKITNVRLAASWREDDLPATEVKWRTDAERTKGEAVTRYYWSDSRGAPLAGSAGFATLAEARKALIDHVAKVTTNTSMLPLRSVEYGIVAVVRREDGSDLTRVRRELVSAKVTAEVTYTTPAPLPTQATPDGWVFFGWASS